MNGYTACGASAQICAEATGVVICVGRFVESIGADEVDSVIFVFVSLTVA